MIVRGALSRTLLGLIALAASLTASPSARAQVTVDMVMADGVKLRTDVYALTFDPQPVLLVRTPYGREGFAELGWTLAADLEAMVVVQDVRGRGGSEGEDVVFRADAADGRETVEWMEALGWSDGVVAGWGGDALSITQMLMAPGAPPAYRCQHIVAGTADLPDGAVYVGGVRRVELDAWLESQGVPEVAAEWAAHPDPDDPWWEPVRVDAAERAQVEVAGLQVTGWFDLFLQGTIDWHVGLQGAGGDGARGRQKLVIGPWAHDGGSGELAFPGVDEGDPRGLLEDTWAAECLHALTPLDAAGDPHDGPAHGSAWDELAPVWVFVMGPTELAHGPGNVWQSFDAWPPPAVHLPLYLREDGRMDLEPPEGDEPPDAYSHAPFAPVPAVGGSHLTLPSGSYDQAEIEARADVAVFSSPPLEEPAEVVGALEARLFVHASAGATDVVVRLTDVYPDGRSMWVASGLRRFKGAGKPQEVVVDLWATAYVFGAGHRIRVSVSGAMAGAFEVAPEPFTALVTHTAAQPSHLLLPVRAGLGVDEVPLPPDEDAPGGAEVLVADGPGADAGGGAGDALAADAFDAGGDEQDASEIGPSEDAADAGGPPAGDSSSTPDTGAGADTGPGPAAEETVPGAGSGGCGGCGGGDQPGPWGPLAALVAGWLVRRRLSLAGAERA